MESNESDKPPSDRRRAAHAFIAPLCLFLCSIAVTLAAIELVFRTVRVHVGTVAINRRAIRRSGDPRLRFELKPGAVAHAEVEYRINQQGMRQSEVSVAKGAQTRRIAVVGDSIAFGYWVAEEHAFPRQLERLLNARVGSHERVEVLNFGVPGYDLEQEIAVVRVRAARFEPDVVIVALCLNDFEGAASYESGLVIDRSRRTASLFGRAWDLILDRSVLAAWLEYRFTELEARRIFVRARDPLASPATAPTTAQRSLMSVRFRALARELRQAGGAAGLVAIFPTFSRRFARYPHAAQHGAVSEAARGAGLEVVDLIDCYQTYDFRSVRVDVVHPNPLGHRIAAHALLEALCQRRLLCDGMDEIAALGDCHQYQAGDFPTVRGY